MWPLPESLALLPGRQPEMSHRVQVRKIRRSDPSNAAKLTNSEYPDYSSRLGLLEVTMQTLVHIAVLALLALFVVSPIAWACEVSGVAECTMEACPMADPGPEPHCPLGDAPMDGMAEKAPATGGHIPPGGPAVNCCDSTSAPDADATPSQALSVQLRQASTAAGTVLVERPPKLPMEAARIHQSQQHEVGRFTILSSFLL